MRPRDCCFSEADVFLILERIWVVIRAEERYVDPRSFSRPVLFRDRGGGEVDGL